MKFRTKHTPYNPQDYGFMQLDHEVSMTRQEEAAEADINVVMERFMRTGQLPQARQKQPRFGDAQGIPYDQALMIVKQAEEAFQTLPAKVRKEFYNDPAEMQKFLNDPSNDARAVELGLKEYQKPSSDDLLTDIVKNTKKDPTPSKKES